MEAIVPEHLITGIQARVTSPGPMTADWMRGFLEGENSTVMLYLDGKAYVSVPLRQIPPFNTVGEWYELEPHVIPLERTRVEHSACVEVFFRTRVGQKR